MKRAQGARNVVGPEEIDAALELVPAAVNRLREIAPAYAGTLG